MSAGVEGQVGTRLGLGARLGRGPGQLRSWQEG